MNNLSKLEDINKKIVASFGYPLSQKEHLFNLTFSALAIAIYSTVELDRYRNDHIIWLSHNCINNFYDKDLEIDDILFFHKNIIPPNKKTIFKKDGKIDELKTIKRGEFRTINTYLDRKGHFRYFIDYKEIKKEIKKMIKEFNRSSRNIKDISQVLLEGFRIHPFMDGNGKTFRAIFDLLLIKNNYYPSLFNCIYKKNKILFENIFTYYSMVDKNKGREDFLVNLIEVYKYSYFSQ